MWSIKGVIIILLFKIKLNAAVPNYNMLALGEERTEILQDIWTALNVRTGRRAMNYSGASTDVGVDFNAFHIACTLTQEMFQGMTQRIWQNVDGNHIGHEIHFKKESFSGNLGRDPTDTAPIIAIFASVNNNWNITVNPPQGGSLHLHLGARYVGLLGVVLCRRQQIEHLRVFRGYFCDIDTWLLFLCMQDFDIQRPELKNPEDYNRYLGGRSESHVFKFMAREECYRKIGAIPKDAKITGTLIGSSRQLEYSQRVYVMASRLSNYDYILIRKRRIPRRRQSINNPPIDCPDMDLLRNDDSLFLEAARGGMRQKYDFNWFFCEHDAGAPLRINPANRKIQKDDSVNDHRNFSDVNFRGTEL